METNQRHVDDFLSEMQSSAMDDTIVLVALLVMRATLFKSGYDAETMLALEDRLAKLIKRYSRKGV